MVHGRESFKATDMARKQRLNKVVAGAGFASRRKAEDIIREGRVKVNNEVGRVQSALADSVNMATLASVGVYLGVSRG